MGIWKKFFLIRIFLAEIVGPIKDNNKSASNTKISNKTSKQIWNQKTTINLPMRTPSVRQSYWNYHPHQLASCWRHECCSAVWLFLLRLLYFHHWLFHPIVDCWCCSDYSHGTHLHSFGRRSRSPCFDLWWRYSALNDYLEACLLLFNILLLLLLLLLFNIFYQNSTLYNDYSET